MSKKQAMASKKAPAKTDRPKDAGDGRTQVEQGGESAPRLPHERDQSSDSQQNQGGSAERGRKGMEDVERGVVDTDRGPAADRVYNEKLKP
ncbi:hypothetical protein [Variovorax soli]|uniref:Uncharacterized protein n=1 Tax=Variovorax soli TaxID=376815 RepID=A0ABU1N962_9BURK|nr:hypothetical protein [Variovorax soli]MDR6534970.1 hypothetical protein [Variovorax soli]